MAKDRVQVRLYSAGGPSSGRVFRSKDVLQATWRVTRLSGYADASIELAGLPSEHPGLVNDARIEIWGWDTTQQAYLRLYRGYVLQVVGQGRKSTEPRKTKITLYGFWNRVARQVALQRYVWTSAIDLSSVFTALIAKWASIANVGTTYTLDSQTTTITISSLDAWKKPLFAIIDQLDTAAAHQIVVGCDVSSTGANRAYIRPFETTAKLVASLPDPSNQVELIEANTDSRQRSNVLYLTGGQALYPNLAYAATRDQDGAGGEGNSSFENPKLGSSIYGNLFLNPGFESGFTSWTTTGDPAVHDTTDPDGPSYEGEKFLELDNYNAGAETVKQTVTTGVVAGAAYTIQFFARSESLAGTIPEGLVTINWKAGLSLISTSTVNFGGALSPIPTDWTQYAVPVTAPATTTQAEIIFSAPVASFNFGILLDGLSFYRSDRLYQTGWEVVANTGGAVGEVDWAVQNPRNALGTSLLPFHGAYCVLLTIATASSGSECLLRPRAGASVAVQGGTSYVLSKQSLSPYGYSTTPTRKLVIEELDKDGNTIGIYKKTFPSVIAYTVWTQEEFQRTLSQNCRAVRFWEEYLSSSGSLYSDAFSFRNAAATGGYIEGDNLERVLRADDAALGLTGDVATSIADLGIWPEVTQEDALTSDSDAQTWGAAALKDRAVAQQRPRVVWVGSPTLPGSSTPPWPGQVIKGMGSIGGAALPTPLPITEISGEWQETGGAMLLRMTASLKTDPENEARILQQFIRRIKMIGR